MINKQTYKQIVGRYPDEIIQKQTIDQTIGKIEKQYTTQKSHLIEYLKIATKVKDKIKHIANLQTGQGIYQDTMSRQMAR